ncbi:MAG: hypothetical protein ACOX6X_01450 [Dethiobacteria bacterium]
MRSVYADIYGVFLKNHFCRSPGIFTLLGIDNILSLKIQNVKAKNKVSGEGSKPLKKPVL